jgi:hypothetical protein
MNTGYQKSKGNESHRESKSKGIKARDYKSKGMKARDSRVKE